MTSNLIYATILLLVSSTTVVFGQSSECEELLPDGSTAYHACFSEPLSLISSARGFYNLSVEPENSTCGDPSLLYCTLTVPKECKYCDSNSTTDSHPPANIVDQSGSATWWQSITWPKPSFPNAPEITITLSFGKTYELTDDLGILFKSGRPQNMILEKSTDNGATWSVLQYYARDCTQYYNIGAGLETDITMANPAKVICSESYSGQLPRSGGTVTFSVTESRYKLFLGPAYSDYQSLFSAFENTQLDEYMTFTDLRIKLLYPATDGKEVFGSYIDFLHYYYAISNIGVTVR
ncbi:netrin-G2-like [Lineus longissimus]|uniref:netrin-G2-like n=1 Tax=Lineus longissimus TaxID=88925 RepID=UPI00315DC052